jgi:hypothetical protein
MSSHSGFEIEGDTSTCKLPYLIGSMHKIAEACVIEIINDAANRTNKNLISNRKMNR